MATILLTTEIGRTYGHASHLLRVGSLLGNRGHKLVAACTSVVNSASILSAAGIPVLQAPVWPTLRDDRFAGYGDRLTQFGFISPDGLGLLLDSWQSLFDLVKPDLLVADHSPVAVLAGYGSIPTAHIGNATVLPPTHLPEFPRLDPNVDEVVDQGSLLRSVQAVQHRRGRPVPSTLPALFASPARAIFAFDEFDPYHDARTEKLLGPIEAMPIPTAMPPTQRIFAYLGGDRSEVGVWAGALLDTGAEIECHIRDDTGLISRYLSRHGALVHKQPAPLPEVIARCNLVVSNGSLVVAESALAGGRPHFGLPVSMETQTNSNVAARLGTGAWFDSGAPRGEISAAIRAALNDKEMAERAQSYAVRLMRRLPTFADEKAAEMCLALLESASSVRRPVGEAGSAAGRPVGSNLKRPD